MDNCAFCKELADEKPGTKWGDDVERECRILYEDDSFVVMPTVGSFTSGYVLLIPKEHVEGFSQVTEPEWVQKAVPEITKILTNELDKHWNVKPTIMIAEHGASGICPTQKGAQCCDHAHLHFIPLVISDNIIWEEYRAPADANGLFYTFETFESLGKYSNDPYCSLSVNGGESLLVYPTGYPSFFPSQYCRRVATKLLRIPERYNWRTNPFYENMSWTIEKMKGKFERLRSL